MPSSPPGDYFITPTLLDPDSKLGNYAVTSTNGVLSVKGVALESSTSGDSSTFCWPTTAASFALEFTADLTPPVTWNPVTSGLVTNGAAICHTTTPSPVTPMRFYRLRLP